MAIFHLHVSTFSRAKGQSAVAAACYRAGKRLTDQRLGLRFDYRAKSPSVGASWLTGWSRSRSALWNSAERCETRSNSTVAREIRVAIPRELSEGQAEVLCRCFSRFLWERYGVPVDTSIHRPGGTGRRNHNPHAHFLMTTRRCDVSGTFGEKTREWDARRCDTQDPGRRQREPEGRAICGKDCVAEVRKTWEEMTNDALSRANQTARIDRRSLIEQSTQREAINYARATLELEKRGLRSQQGEEMKLREKRNAFTSGRALASRPIATPHIPLDDMTGEQKTKVQAPLRSGSQAYRKEIQRLYRTATSKVPVPHAHLGASSRKSPKRGLTH